MENSIVISENNGELVVSSRQVAENFGKRHDHVIRDIESIISHTPILGADTKAEFSALTSMFHETTYKAGTGKSYKEYLMNRDGFSLLVMGFTGKEAMAWKIKYIQAFNEMEKKLKEPAPLQREQLEVDLYNAKTAQANLWLLIAGNTNNATHKEICNAYAANTLAGREVFALPMVEQKTYTATEIGNMLGISANKVGKIANEHCLKNDENGKFFYDKSRYSNKTVESFRYYYSAVDKFRDILKGA